MAISIEQVKKIAELARLELTSEEETKYQKQLSAILDYVGQLQELNVEQWAPEMAGLKHQPADLRLDESDSGRYQSQIVASSPASKDGLITVPAVLGEE